MTTGMIKVIEYPSRVYVTVYSKGEDVIKIPSQLTLNSLKGEIILVGLI